jgi:hypothetical protein
MKTSLYTLLFLLLTSVAEAGSMLYLKVNPLGDYIVSLGNEQIRNRTREYHFFDIPRGNVRLLVKDFNTQFVYLDIVLPFDDNFKYVAEIDFRGNIKLIDKVPYSKYNWYTYYMRNSVWGFPSPWIPNTNPWNNGYNNGNGNNPWNNGNPQNPNPWGNNYPNSYPNNGGGYPYPTPDPWNNGHYERRAMIPMTDNDFNALLNVVKNANFDNQKVDKVKLAAKDNYFMSAQVEKLMDCISFDNYKLDLAKLCYANTTDKNNYFQLMDNFTFDSNAKALQEYINTQK